MQDRESRVLESESCKTMRSRGMWAEDGGDGRGGGVKRRRYDEEATRGSPKYFQTFAPSLAPGSEYRLVDAKRCRLSGSR